MKQKRTELFLEPPPSPPAQAPQGKAPYRLPRRDAQEALWIGKIPLDYARWPSNFAGSVEVAAAALRELPAAASAEAKAMAIMVAVARWLGPGRHYWPNAQDIHTAARDWCIYHHEFNGRNTAQLAAKYKLTVRGMNMLLARQRQHELAVRRRKGGGFERP